MNQETQNKMGFADRADVIVGDKNIFTFYNRKVGKAVDTTQSVVYRNLFPETTYKIAFKDQTIRDDFNEGLKIIREDGKYDQILPKYTK